MQHTDSPNDLSESDNREPLSSELADRLPLPADGDERRIPPASSLVESQRGKWWALALFCATCVSTFFARGLQHSDEGLRTVVFQGLSYSLAVMLILVAHEMGHYLQARRYGIRASLPYFIPMPIAPTGTLGALIVQEPDDADRKQLLDIAITGPLVGLLMALPITYIGLLNSEIEPIPADYPGFVFGEPLVIQWMTERIHGEVPDGYALNPTSFAFAGWFGILVTALMLIPIGRTDGGHILYSLLGKKAHFVAYVVLWGAVAYMFATRNIAYSLLVLLLILMGPRHPPTRDDQVPLGTLRIVLGWLTLAFIIIGFTLKPIVRLPM